MKPVFNPEIFKNSEDVKADEYHSWALLPMLEKAIECKTPQESFKWGEWEDEASISIHYQKFNQMAEDGFFVFETFVSAWFFNDGSSNTNDNPAGLRLIMIERDTLKKFNRWLEEALAEIRAKNIPEPLEVVGDNEFALDEPLANDTVQALYVLANRQKKSLGSIVDDILQSETGGNTNERDRFLDVDFRSGAVSALFQASLLEEIPLEIREKHIAAKGFFVPQLRAGWKIVLLPVDLKITKISLKHAIV